MISLSSAPLKNLFFFIIVDYHFRGIWKSGSNFHALGTVNDRTKALSSKTNKQKG